MEDIINRKVVLLIQPNLLHDLAVTIIVNLIKVLLWTLSTYDHSHLSEPICDNLEEFYS